ncbi:helix-turn-helix domain-containing protein [Amycolatopsis sp. NPDC059021]|uniref:helix-turn-helix domain-containing protein n=1 Tax=Amycolatopsis sp. NPDC059021 TaxID=3346704 RepID=UPI00366CEB04
MRNKPNPRKRLLGRKLQRLREDTGMTQAEAGEPLRFSTSKLSRIELGHLPKYNEFLALLDRYGVIVSDYDGWVRQYDRALEKGWWHAYGLNDKGYVPLEADADEVRTYQLSYIPGLLQTEPWMRAAFACARMPLPPRRQQNEIAVRLRRQERLISDNPLTLHAIVDESVLWRRDLPSAEMRQQLEHLIECAALPNVTLQIISLDFGIHPGRDGGFTVLSYPSFGEPDIAFVEHGIGAMQFEKEHEVKPARLAFDHLADLAFDEEDSIRLIQRVIAET